MITIYGLYNQANVLINVALSDKEARVLLWEAMTYDYRDTHGTGRLIKDTDKLLKMGYTIQPGSFIPCNPPAKIINPPTKKKKRK